MKVAWVRWKALLPLVLLVAVLGAGWVVFADRLGRVAVEHGGTAILGAKVELRSFRISLTHGNVTLRGLVAASPFDSLKNLLEADELVADLDVLPLLEKKLVIDRLAANGLRFGTARTTSGFVASTGPSATERIRDNLKVWAAQPALQVPVLRLATGSLSIDSLDPRRLETIRAAGALAGRADSSRQAWSDAWGRLDLAPAVDSATAFARRLQGAKPTDLRLIADARRTLTQVKQARDRLTALERSVQAGADSLTRGIAGLDSARRRDYAFARTLVKLPPIDAAAIGMVLFGPAAVQRFQRALYYTELARTYMPPGLLPQAHPGPKRVRRSGTTVEFPREHELPGFLLRDAELSLVLGDSAAPRAYAGQLQGLSSAPTVYGRPTTLAIRAPTLTADAQLDHTRRPPRDVAGATVQGVRLPEIGLPGLPIRLAPGTGEVTVGFSLNGDSLHGRWDVSAPAAAWRRDSSATSGPAADLVWRVVSGIGQVALTTEITGTVRHPVLHVRSNLDQAVADQVRALVGDQVAAAETKLRAAVDSLADQAVAPVRAQVASVTAQMNDRVAQGRRSLDAAQRALEDQLKRLTGGIRLP